MNFIQTLVAFLFALGVLIVFHELGHYWVARWCNVKVLRFSIGMGKVLFSRRLGKDKTEWALAALPLGGYVKMLDLREQDGEQIASEDLNREFTRQSVWKRIAIVSAGPIANFILAIILFSILFMVGVDEPIAKLRQPDVQSQAYRLGLRANDVVTAIDGRPVQFWSELRWELLKNAIEKKDPVVTLTSSSTHLPYQVVMQLNQISPDDIESDFLSRLGLALALSEARLGNFLPDSPAFRAGFQKGDIVTGIDGKPVLDSLDLIAIVKASSGRLLHVKVNRSGDILELLVTPDTEVTDKGVVGKLKVEVSSFPETAKHQDSLLGAIPKAVQRTWTTSALTLKMMAKMLTGEVSLKNITGPLTIADYAGQTAKTGLISYISFLAFISISLGVMNLLPIPILDGGHLLYYSLEVLTGRPVSIRVWELSQRAGLAILMFLMVVAFFNDIARLLPT